MWYIRASIDSGSEIAGGDVWGSWSSKEKAEAYLKTIVTQETENHFIVTDKIPENSSIILVNNT